MDTNPPTRRSTWRGKGGGVALEKRVALHGLSTPSGARHAHDLRRRTSSTGERCWCSAGGVAHDLRTRLANHMSASLLRGGQSMTQLATCVSARPPSSPDRAALQTARPLCNESRPRRGRRHAARSAPRTRARSVSLATSSRYAKLASAVCTLHARLFSRGVCRRGTVVAGPADWNFNDCGAGAWHRCLFLWAWPHPEPSRSAAATPCAPPHCAVAPKSY